MILQMLLSLQTHPSLLFHSRACVLTLITREPTLRRVKEVYVRTPILETPNSGHYQHSVCILTGFRPLMSLFIFSSQGLHQGLHSLWTFAPMVSFSHKTGHCRLPSLTPQRLDQLLLASLLQCCLLTNP